MIKVNLLIESDILSALNEQISQLPAITRGAVSRVYRRYRARIIKDLAAYPGPPAGTFKNKATPKQRRYVMMLIRKGIWTGRTGKLARSWKLSSRRANKAEQITLENTAENERGQPYSPYVQGDYQQPFHLDTGWKAAAPIIVKYETLIGEALIEEWITLVDERAGIR